MAETTTREVIQQRRRRPRQGPVTRRQILDSSLRLFSERGYARTSVRDIAQAVGITDAAIYYYFDSKKDLLRSLFEERGIVAALRELEEMDPGPDPEKQLQAISLAALGILTRNRDFLKVLLVEALTEASEAVDEWRAVVDRWVQAIHRLLVIYKQRGTLLPEADELVAEQMVDSVLGAYIHALMPGHLDITKEGEPSERLQRRVALSVESSVCALKS